jgi:type 1 glutamine amidotransferase
MWMPLAPVTWMAHSPLLSRDRLLSVESMKRFLSLLIALTLGYASVFTSSRAAVNKPKPLRALMVCGGCCHDYTNQKKILSEGISAQANVEWTIVQEAAPKGGDERNHRVSIYEKPDWWKGYDVVVHNECFGAVGDNAFIEGITAAHKAGVPAVFLHCSSHSYRAGTTDEWRKCVGITSRSHEKNRDLNVKVIKADHPVMKGFPAEWLDPKDELYKNEFVWPNCVPLAKAYGEDTKQDHNVIWVSTYEDARVFTTTLGHNNSTMAAPEFLGLVTRGLLWACGKLNDDGIPADGYGPAGK